MPTELICETTTHSVTDTAEYGVKFAKTLSNGNFVAFYGGLGVGKTAFITGLANEIVPTAYVHSPTYSILNLYVNESDGRKIYHYDMYRISDENDLYGVGFYETDSDAIVLIEWSENIEFALPCVYFKITIGRTESADDNLRSIKIEKVDNSV
jgi:tRNA threonylcarbamoyladenosine biosynthesis protein TsaE